MFLDEIVKEIDGKIDTFIFQGYNDLVDMLAPALLATVTLYIIVQGIRVFIGHKQSPFNYIRDVMLISFVMMLGANWDWFSKIIVDLTMNGPDEFIAILIDSDSDSMQELFGDLYAQSLDAFHKLFSTGGWTNISLLAIVMIGYLTNIALMTIIFFLIVTAKIALAVLLVLAPLFIPMYFFESTKQFCWGWIRSIMTMVLIPIMLYAVTGLFVDILSQHVFDISNGVNDDSITVDPIFEYIITALICVVLVKQVPFIAANISGGASVNSSARQAFFKGTEKMTNKMKIKQ